MMTSSLLHSFLPTSPHVYPPRVFHLVLFFSSGWSQVILQAFRAYARLRRWNMHEGDLFRDSGGQQQPDRRAVSRLHGKVGALDI